MRKRGDIVGIRRDCHRLRRLRLPHRGVRPGRDLSILLRPAYVALQIEDDELSYTELRNWTSIQAELVKKAVQNSDFPIIPDFQMSQTFGTSWRKTKTRPSRRRGRRPEPFGSLRNHQTARTFTNTAWMLMTTRHCRGGMPLPKSIFCKLGTSRTVWPAQF